MRKQSWMGILISSVLAGVLVGCGGGGGDAGPIGGGGGGGNPVIDTTAIGTARVDVDVATGKVKVTPLGGDATSRSLYAGSSISVAASNLFTDAGELTVKKMKLTLTNNTADTIGGEEGAQLIVDRISSDGLGFLDLREHTNVATVVGPGTSAADGVGSSVTITSPSGIARGTDGSIYIAGQGDGSLRRLRQNYVNRLVTGVATPGGVDVLPGSGFAFIVEQSTHNLVRVPIDGGSKFTLAGGGASGLVDGAGAAARFNGPRDLTITGDAAFIADYNNDRIRKVTNLTGGSGSVTTLNVFPVITRPSGIATALIDGTVWLVVCSTQTNRVFLVNSVNGQSFTIAGTGAAGYSDGPGTNAVFNQPSDVAVVGNTIFVADLGNRMVRQLSLRTGADAKFASSWAVKTIAGEGSNGSADGLGTTATFGSPRYIVADGSGALYVTDLTNNRVRLVTPTSGVFPITGQSGFGAGVVTVGNPDTYVPDPINLDNRKAVFNLDPLAAGGTQDKEIEFIINGESPTFYFFVSIVGIANATGALDAVVNTTSPFRGSANVNVRGLAGNGIGFADGAPVTARFGSSPQIAATDEGIYVADQSVNRVRRIDHVTGNTVTIADAPSPTSIWMNKAGTVGFVSGNGYIMYLARPYYTDPKVRSSWTISLIVGVVNTTGLVNGNGSVARTGIIYGLAADPDAKTLFFTDSTNNEVRAATIAGTLDPTDPTNWNVSLVAGAADGTSGYVDGSGTAVRFADPRGIAIAKDGSMYVTENAGRRVRKIRPNLEVTLLAGSTAGSSGMVDDIGSLARFGSLGGIAVDNAGYVYVADSTNRLIRRISAATGEVRTVAGVSNYILDADGPGNQAGFASLVGVSFVPGRGLIISKSGRICIAERIVRNGNP